MRLICPNCDAQYEVDSNAIPPMGRDVQCSSCGHGWFQAPQTEPDEPLAEAALILDAAMPAPAAVAMPEPMPQPEGERHTGPRRVPVVAMTGAEEDDEEALAPPLPPVMPMRRSLDESVLAVLREEAEREAAARRAEAQTIEVQGELGLPPPVSPMVGHKRPTAAENDDDIDREFERELEAEMRAEAAAKRSAPPQREPANPPNHAQSSQARREAVQRGGARRDMFPDIEEINSTLLSTEPKHKVAVVETAQEARGGFRTGFLLMIALAVLVVGIYVAAPTISNAVPQLTPLLEGYVAAVDQARAALDQAIRKATGMMDGLTAARQ